MSANNQEGSFRKSQLILGTGLLALAFAAASLIKLAAKLIERYAFTQPIDIGFGIPF